MVSRRRFLAISASACAVPSVLGATEVLLHIETGIALGAKIKLRLHAANGPELGQAAMAEIHRLERIFSLYLPDSELVRLNEVGYLEAPSFELLDCLAMADRVYRASGGRFDPTVQALWRVHASAAQSGRLARPDEVEAAQSLLGWDQVRFSSESIKMKSGMALSLNGIAQGYIADRVVKFLSRRGLTNALIDTGEFHALGSSPEGLAWKVRLPNGNQIGLQQRSLATSSPLGMTFGGDGVTGHIIDPTSGFPVPALWAAVSISSDKAGLADALSTAACLYADEAEIHALCSAFPDTRVESLTRSA